MEGLEGTSIGRVGGVVDRKGWRLEGLEGTTVGRDGDWKGWKGLRLEETPVGRVKGWTSIGRDDVAGRVDWKGLDHDVVDERDVGSALRLERLEGTPVGRDGDRKGWEGLRLEETPVGRDGDWKGGKGLRLEGTPVGRVECIG